MSNVIATQASSVVKERPCPLCGATVPVYDDYIPWCECGWNLQPQKPERPLNIFESMYESAGKKLGKGLFDELAQAEFVKPRLTLSTLLAFALAALIHALTLGAIILGVALLIAGRSNLFALLGAIICLAVAWFLRPRATQLQGEIVPRDQFPTLYSLADQIAQALATSKVDGIVIDWPFNASFSQVGWRRKKIVYLGLPLLSILNGQEKVNLMAHEIAHAVNGDFARGFFVGTAINSLIGWYYLLIPSAIWPADSGLYGLAMVPINLAAWVLAWIARLGATALIHLLWRNSQRAEYLADHLAAQVSGTDAALSGLEKLHLDNTFIQTVQRLSLTYQDEQNFFDTFRWQVASVPAREFERIRRVARLAASRLDATHPPTGSRIELLKPHPSAQPKVALSPSEIEQIDRELSSVQKKVQTKLLDIHRRSLYY